MALRPAKNITRSFGNKRVTPPAVEPVTLAQAKAHMRITDADSDSFIIPLIREAREILEQISGLALITQGWLLTIDNWPGGLGGPWWSGTRVGSINELYGGLATIELPCYPLQTVDSVTTYDQANLATVVNIANTFYVDTQSRRGRLALKSGAVWPTALRQISGVQIAYTAGYGDTHVAVPEPLKRAIRVMVMYLFEHRGNCGARDAYNKSGAAEILRLYRDVRI